MAFDTIKLKRGLKSKLSKLSYGEPAYISDENELYIGTEDGVEKITRNKEVAELSSQLEHNASQLSYITKKLININIKYPPNNLKGASGDGKTDDTLSILNILDYAKGLDGDVLIEVPFGTYLIQDTLNIPSNVLIIGNNSTFIFKNILGNAIVINSNNKEALKDLRIKGETYENDIIGLNVTGSSLTFTNISIDNFGTGLSLVNNDTYINTFDKLFIRNTSLALDLRMANTTNAGERLSFINSTLCNSKLLFSITGNSNYIFFDNCSFDYCNKTGIIHTGYAFFSNCHFENCIKNELRTWRSEYEYMIEVTGGGNLYFTNTEFQLYDMKSVLYDADSAGAPVTSFVNCFAYFYNGSSQSSISTSTRYFISSGTTNVQVNSPFLGKSVGVSVELCSDYRNNFLNANYPSSVSFDNSENYITLNWDVGVNKNTLVRINYN